MKTDYLPVLPASDDALAAHSEELFCRVLTDYQRLRQASVHSADTFQRRLETHRAGVAMGWVGGNHKALTHLLSLEFAAREHVQEAQRRGLAWSRNPQVLGALMMFEAGCGTA